MPVLREQSVDRTASILRRANAMRATGTSEAEIASLWRGHDAHEMAVLDSMGRFAPVPDALLDDARRSGQAMRRSLAGPLSPAPAVDPRYAIVYRRAASPKGPMSGFGYSWLDDQLGKAALPRPALLDRPSAEEGPSFAYEALNLVDGVRDVQAIRDRLAAASGPVPVEEVAAFLATLETLKLIAPRRN